MIKKAEYLILIAAIAALSLAGVSSSQVELSETELVRTMAIDYRGGRISLTVSAGTGAEDSEISVSSSEGDTLSDAVYNLQNGVTDHAPIFSHTEHIVIGEEAAKSGAIPEILDFVSRSKDMRTDTGIYISKGMTAREFLLGGVGDKTAEADMLSRLAENVDLLTAGHAYTCGDVTARLLKSSCALIAAVTIDENDELGDKAKTEVSSVGFAIIKDGYLLEYTDEDETKGACILENTAKFETVTVPAGDVTVTLGITSSRANVQPVFSGDKITAVKIRVKLKADIQQITGNVDIKSEKVRSSIEKALEVITEERVYKAINASKSVKADFLRIGEKCEMASPDKARSVPGGSECILDYAAIDVKAEASIERTYDAVEYMGGANGKK